MKNVKPQKSSLEKMRGIFFQSGLIIAFGLTLVAFEWTTPVYISELGDPIIVAEGDFELPPITYREIEKPKVKHDFVKKTGTIVKVVKSITEPIDPTPTEPIIETVTFDPTWVTVETPVLEKDVPRIGAEHMPMFEGGDAGIFKYLKENTKYPMLAKEAGIHGTVHLKFVVGKNGKIRNIEVLKGVNKLLDDEAIRVVKSMPGWKPGTQHGKPVSVYYTLPIKFTLM
jgi:protein TonB